DRPLYSTGSYAYNWPFVPARSYFLRVPNTTGAPASFTFQMDGRDRSDDSDGDGLPDWWAHDHFGALYYDGAGDYDSDGLANADELAGGTDPVDRDSDDDTLSDGLEVATGADPLDGDSDADLSCDGEDSAPTDPNESGPIIRLRMGELEGGEYGN